MSLFDLTALQLGKALKAGRGDRRGGHPGRPGCRCRPGAGVQRLYHGAGDQALERARSLEGKLPDSPLAGVPAGIRTTSAPRGSRPPAPPKFWGILPSL